MIVAFRTLTSVSNGSMGHGTLTYDSQQYNKTAHIFLVHMQYNFIDWTTDSLGRQERIAEVKCLFHFIICYCIKLSVHDCKCRVAIYINDFRFDLLLQLNTDRNCYGS